MIYPPWTGVFRFGSVFAVVYWQGLAPLSSLSFSRSAFSWQNPGSCQPPVPRCHHREAPDASVRYPNLSSFSPDWPCGFGPNPTGGFEAPLKRLAPTLNKTDLPHYSGRRFPLARIRGRAKRMR